MPQPGDVAMQLYSSGTTGRPKGVMLTNDNFFALLPTGVDLWDFTSDAVNLVAMPLFHIGGSGWATVGQVVGAKSVILRELDLAELVRLFGGGLTHAFVVPAVLQFLLMVPDAATTDYSTLKMIAYGASPITDEVLAGSIKMFGCDFWQVYGLTETTGAITLLPPEDHDLAGPNTHRLRSCGKPGPGVDLRIVDLESGEDATDPNVVGEILIRSPQVMKGYWNNEAATREAIDDDGWFKSGDVGYLDADGYLYIHDRVKDMIVSGGENVYPAEVENVLMAHPGDRRHRGDRRARRQVGRDRQGHHRGRGGCRAVGAGRDRLRPREPRQVQVPDKRRLRRRAAPQPERQDPEEGSARSVLGRAGASGELKSLWISTCLPTSPPTSTSSTTSSSARSSRSRRRTTTSASSTTAARTRAPTGTAAACRTRSGRRCSPRRAAAPTPPATTATRSRRSTAARTAPTSAWPSSASTSRAKGLGLHNDLQNEHSIVGNNVGLLLMLDYGTDEQKAEWIDDLAEGRRGFAFGITEPDHGSDATHMETTRRPRRRRVGHQRREDVEHRHPQGARTT